MRKIAYFISCLMIFLCSVGASASVEKVRISEAEKEYLARSIAVCYPDLSYGGRVSIAAVVLNRMGCEVFPDSASGAVMSLAAEGEFTSLDKVSAELNEKLLRLSVDAAEAAISGADPSGGALYFESVDREKWRGDLLFNDFSEDESRRVMQNYFTEKYGVSAVIIDGIGFWGSY